jgi:isoamyl acetate esterase
MEEKTTGKRRIILIGDSIRKGYQPFVKKQLEGEFDLWGPEENGGTSGNIISHIKEWLEEKQVDLIHINCGLHDIKRDKTSLEIKTPAVEYENNLKQIFEIIQQKGNIKIIWAATTPVNEAAHNKIKPFYRYEKDIEEYNRIASKITREMDIPVNDLFGFVEKIGKYKYLVNDGVHFTQEGYAVLGREVARIITNCQKQNR